MGVRPVTAESQTKDNCKLANKVDELLSLPNPPSETVDCSKLTVDPSRSLEQLVNEGQVLKQAVKQLELIDPRRISDIPKPQ